jgi:cellulose synthase/poly-beta-1,6-N-acetylglucosamine synthase-like glycosyltransferase
MSKVLCSVATRGRYFTTLPLVLNAIISQTRPVDKLIVFDDNDEPQDLRKELVYSYFFQMLDIKGIEWEWKFAMKKGQHHIHQMANIQGYEWVWRCDDDAIPEPNVLENLVKHVDAQTGAVGGSILTPPHMPDTGNVTGLIDQIDNEPNIQWSVIKEVKQVEHLHCSFLYRAGIVDYNLGLSRVAHREETLFSWGLHRKGYTVKVVPNAVTWHMKNPQGGIRAETNRQLYEHDEQIFRNHLAYRDKTIVVLNCGLGDHVVFSHVLPEIQNAEVFTCYPEIVPGKSIAEAQYLFGDVSKHNIYEKMNQWRWTDSLENAYRKLYL